MKAEDINAGIISRNFNLKKKQRIDWRRELRNERNKVLTEAINDLKGKMRTVPKQWHRGYFSAITTLEGMKNGNN